MLMPADSTTMVSTTCMLPLLFTVMRESNELIRSVSFWAAADTANSKARKQPAKKFFMEVRLNYSLAAGWLEEQSCVRSKLSYRRCLVFTHPPGNNLGTIVILAPHWTASHAPQYCQLPGVR